MTAVEARALPRASDDGTNIPAEGCGFIDKRLRFTGVWVSVLLGVFYTLGALLLSLNIPSDDNRLPRLSWITPQGSSNTDEAGQSTSGFVIVATASGIACLGEFVTIGLLLTAIAAANTFLYVASRTLFGLVKDLDDGSSQWVTRLLAFFGKTTRLRVPVRAVVASCCICWVPFLWLSPSNGTGTSISTVSHTADSSFDMLISFCFKSAVRDSFWDVHKYHYCVGGRMFRFYQVQSLVGLELSSSFTA